MSQKTFLVVSSLCIVLFALPATVLAEDSQKSERQALKEKLQKLHFDMKNASGDAKKREFMQSFKEQRAALTDEKKKQILERLETKMTSVSAKHYDHLFDAHQRLTAVYNKLVEKEGQLEAAGNDTASAAAALLVAKAALDKAHASISSHSATPYKLDVTDEQNLKFGVQKLLRQIQSDYKNDKRLLKEAKAAIKKAARLLAIIEKKGGNDGPTPATSAAN